MSVPCGERERERERENERPKEGKAPTHFELLQQNNSGRTALTFPRKGEFDSAGLTYLLWLDIAEVIYIVRFNRIL